MWISLWNLQVKYELDTTHLVKFTSYFIIVRICFKRFCRLRLCGGIVFWTTPVGCYAIFHPSYTGEIWVNFLWSLPPHIAHSAPQSRGEVLSNNGKQVTWYIIKAALHIFVHCPRVPLPSRVITHSTCIPRQYFFHIFNFSSFHIYPRWGRSEICSWINFAPQGSPIHLDFNFFHRFMG